MVTGDSQNRRFHALRMHNPYSTLSTENVARSSRLLPAFLGGTGAIIFFKGKLNEWKVVFFMSSSPPNTYTRAELLSGRVRLSATKFNGVTSYSWTKSSQEIDLGRSDDLTI
jgi:hypothetical protein